MAKCDLCSKPCNAPAMAQLLNIYRVDGVIDVCKECQQWADQRLSDIRSEIGPRMRAAIANRKESFQLDPPLGTAEPMPRGVVAALRAWLKRWIRGA